MLRLPRFELRQPTSVAEATRLLTELGPTAVVIAGGTDLLPNMKHELVTPAFVVSLGRIEAGDYGYMVGNLDGAEFS